MIKQVKNTVLFPYVVSDLNGDEIIGAFYGAKTNQQTFRIKKVIKRKRNKLYVKWNGWINKKDVEWNSVACNFII